MRVTSDQIRVFNKFAHRYFGEDVKLWLFGSRVDDMKKGGDYDFLVETDLIDADEIVERKIALLAELQGSAEFEDERIDIVVKRRVSAFEMPIYEVAKNEGVRIRHQQARWHHAQNHGCVPHQCVGLEAHNAVEGRHRAVLPRYAEQNLTWNLNLNPNNPLALKPPPTPLYQGECAVSSPEVGQAGNPRGGCSHKGRLGGVGVEFLANGQFGLNIVS